MTFEWDERKNEINKKKHSGITFQMAAKIFFDPNVLIQFDENHSALKEERWNAIGSVEDVLFVVFTEIIEGTIRIISARKANREERNEYYRNYDA